MPTPTKRSPSPARRTKAALTPEALAADVARQHLASVFTFDAAFGFGGNRPCRDHELAALVDALHAAERRQGANVPTPARVAACEQTLARVIKTQDKATARALGALSDWWMTKALYYADAGFLVGLELGRIGGAR